MTTSKDTPGKVLERVLAERPESDHLAFLAWAEQQARQMGDIDLLREVRAYYPGTAINNSASAGTLLAEMMERFHQDCTDAGFVVTKHDPSSGTDQLVARFIPKRRHI